MPAIALYVCPQTVCASLSLANDAFGLANHLAGRPLFTVRRVSADGQPVDLGFARIQVDGDLAAAETADVLIVPATGSAIDACLAANAPLLAWLTQRPAHQQIASLCSAAFLLGAAGLFDGRRATTHWALANPFRQRFPGARLDIDALVCHDGPILSSGGAQAGLDLCLYLIAWHTGDALAEQVANTLVVDGRRTGQLRHAPLIPASPARDRQIEPLLQWMQQHHADAIDLNRLAEQANCSPRTLLRRFKACTGMTPNDYLQRLRIGQAQQALRNPAHTLEQVAEQVGYADRATFAKLFKQLSGETPGAFRKRLHLTLPQPSRRTAQQSTGEKKPAG
ncbi:GlxA family transcriptional regulator [Pseudomonas sp.]|uniref:GlxA family transcriptional regulator n=1 Tax=Pseudomonas sp. TaxID=306 RepID=UPI003D0A74AB